MTQPKLERYCIIRPYGPGKYDTVLDQYVHGLTLDGWCDEETTDYRVGYGDTWYGVIRAHGVDMLKDAPSFLEPLNKAERAMLTACAGVLVSEDSQGFVSVDYCDTPTELEAKWANVLAICGGDDDQETL